MDWTRMGGFVPPETIEARQALLQGWRLGAGTRLDLANDDLAVLTRLKAAEGGGKGRASIFTKALQWLRARTQSTPSNSTAWRRSRSGWGSSSNPARTW